MFKELLPAIMKKAHVILTLIILTVMNMSAQTPNEKALTELERHIELGNLSENISDKLKEFFNAGGELDDSDWLYFLQSGLSDIEEASISELIERRNSKISIKKEDIIKVLNEAGFKVDLKSESNKEFKILQKELTETSANIALQDTNKAILKDTEADVLKGNDAYIFFLQQLSEISDSKFVPTDVKETWETETGPITVKLTSWEKQFEFKPEYFDDWLDGRVIEDINNELVDSKCGFYTIQCDYITGQEILIIFLYEHEKQILEDKLNWRLLKLR